MGASPFVFLRLKKVAPSGCGKGNWLRMLHNVKISLAAVLALSACVALVSLADAAVQRFTDEAGVVLYTIDDDGIVSMFESRPGTDITLSVTRGTREQMQPQITEITPQGVAAETGGFCIEIDRSYSGDVRKAERACAMAGKRLCQAIEWQNACEQAKSNGLGLKNMTGEWEWTGSYAKYDVQVQTGERDLSDELKSVLLGKNDCQTQYLYPSWRPGPYPGRCCK